MLLLIGPQDNAHHLYFFQHLSFYRCLFIGILMCKIVVLTTNCMPYRLIHFLRSISCVDERATRSAHTAQLLARPALSWLLRPRSPRSGMNEANIHPCYDFLGNVKKTLFQQFRCGNVAQQSCCSTLHQQLRDHNVVQHYRHSTLRQRSC